MAKFHSKRWLPSIIFASFIAHLVSAVVDDPAKDVTPESSAYVLFRSANMESPDKLSTGIGFHSFRIPSVVTTGTGRILAFAEGRKYNHDDFGDINLVYKRTKTTDNNGESASDWEELQEIMGNGNGTWGNPTSVVDGSTIYVFMNWNDGDYSQNGPDGPDMLPNGVIAKKIDTTWEGRRHLYLTQRIDDGATWSNPVDMTKQLTPDGWAWDAVGPGRGIVLTTGELIIPAKGRNVVGRGSPGQRTWSYLSLTGAGSEGTITQTPDSRLYRNDRGSEDDDYRLVARGTLTTFGAFALDTGLPDPAAEASTLLYNLESSSAPSRVIFLNSADKEERRHMRVRISYDSDAAKFNFGRPLSDAALSNVGIEGGYSSMTKTGDKRIGALVESNFSDTGNRLIIWRKFNLSWILNGSNS